MGPLSALDFHELVEVDDPHVSPLDDRIAYVRRTPVDDESYEATVHVVDVDVDDGTDRQFTVDEGVDSEPRWSPNGDHLAFVSTRNVNDDRPQLWVLPTDGGEARQVTDVAGAVSGVRWSPDGSHIAFTQATTAEQRASGLDRAIDDPDDYAFEQPDPRVIDRQNYRADASFKDGRRPHVYVVDLATDVVERITDGEFDHFRPTWGDDQTLYFGSKRHGEEPDDNVRVDILAHDLESGDETRLAQTTATLFLLDTTADGRLVYTTVPEDRPTLKQTEIEVLDPSDGAVVTLTAGFDRTVDSHVEYMEVGRDGSVYFAAPDEGTVPVWTVPIDGDTDPRRVTSSGHTHAASAGTDVIAVVASDWDHPGDLYLATDDPDSPERLTTVNAELLADRTLPEPEPHTFENPDGDAIQGWLLLPPSDATDRETHPLVVEVHGGPHAMWSTSGTMWHEFQTLAARGYAVFWCNPRGSSGYGEAFMASIADGGWGPMAAADVLAGVDTVTDRDDVDADELFLTGGSYGGYMTAWLVGHDDRFTAAVTQRGVYELNGFTGSTDIPNFTEWEFGTTPWEDSTFLWDQSPIDSVDAVDTPTLVMHAENDYRVPINNAELLYLGLTKHGVDTRLVRYPREGHELSRSGEPAHRVDRIERIARWFDGYSSYRDVPRALDRGDEGLTGRRTDSEDA